MMDSQKFCLKWDGFQSSVTSAFDHLRQDGELVDITLCCEGQRVRAHRMMLSACSPYFRDLLKNNPCQQMVFFLKDTSGEDLRAIIEFIYKGSVNVSQTQLASFIKTAEMLQIRGLSGDEDKVAPSPPPSSRQSGAAGRPEPRASAVPPPARPQGSTTPPLAKRRRPSETGEPPSHLQQHQGGVVGQMVSRQSPPPPSSSSASVMETSSMGASPAHSAVQPSAARPLLAGSGGTGPPQGLSAEEEIKIEKVDLTEEDEDTTLDSTLDSTLGYVAEYEGYRETPDLSGAALANAAAVMGGGGVAGPSQRASEDGSQSGRNPLKCKTCGRVYSHYTTLLLHKKVHEGATTCSLCGSVYGRVSILRKHLRRAHNLPEREVKRMTHSTRRIRSSKASAETQKKDPEMAAVGYQTTSDDPTAKHPGERPEIPEKRFKGLVIDFIA